VGSVPGQVAGWFPTGQVQVLAFIAAPRLISVETGMINTPKACEQGYTFYRGKVLYKCLLLLRGIPCQQRLHTRSFDMPLILSWLYYMLQIGLLSCLSHTLFFNFAAEICIDLKKHSASIRLVLFHVSARQSI
jgi:hypothetical protein